MGSFIINTRETQNVQGGAYKVKINALKDTNNNNQGDTEIPYDASSQAFEVNFNSDTNPQLCQRYPSIEILEPTAELIPTKKKDDAQTKSLSIGANIVDDCNELKYITVSFDKKNRNEFNCKCTFAREDANAYKYLDSNGRTNSPCTCFSLEKAPAGEGNEPKDLVPYYWFKLTAPSEKEILKDEEYSIKIEAADKRGESGRAIKEKIVRGGDVKSDEITLNQMPERIIEPTDTLSAPKNP